jgi:hypothetical protein
MASAFSSLGGYFRTFEDRHMRDYFSASAFDSFYFRSAMTAMLIDELIGFYVIREYWAFMSHPVRYWLIFAMISLVVALRRAIFHHNRMRLVIAETPKGTIPDEVLKISASSAYSGISILFVTSAAMLFCFATTLKHIAAAASTRGLAILK